MLSPKALKFAAPVMFLANLGLIAGIWLQASASSFTEKTLAGPLIALGGLAGLLAFYLMLWQLLLIGRVGWIEKAWGHDRLSVVHHVTGIAAAGILLLHPVLLVLGYSKEANTALVSQFWLFLTGYELVANAAIAYVLVLAIVLLSLWTVRKRLRYEVWYFIHFFLYLAVLLSFGHQTENGHSFTANWQIVYWNVLFYGSLVTVGYYRFAKPLLLMRRHGFRVEQVRRENGNVVSIYIGGRDLRRLRAKAGQFVIVRFLSRGLWHESHPFSLSQAPAGARLRLTVKAVGDYTRKLPAVPVGARVVLEGPLGRFTSDRAGTLPVLLIAGGIGITPLRALFEEFVQMGRNVVLLYAAHSPADHVLREEIQALSGPHARVHYFPDEGSGRISAAVIKEKTPDVQGRFVHLCGPSSMMKAMRGFLAELGVPGEHVAFEKFKLG